MTKRNFETTPKTSESVSGIIDDVTKNVTKIIGENDTINPIQASETVSKDIFDGDDDAKNDTKNVPINASEGSESVSGDNDAKNDTKNDTKNHCKKFNDRQLQIYKLIKKDNGISVEKLAEILNISIITAKRDLQYMKEYIVHEGPSNGGYWKIIKTPKR